MSDVTTVLVDGPDIVRTRVASDPQVRTAVVAEPPLRTTVVIGGASGPSPDYQWFRGDWQDPANTLLWSTDFSDPSDADYFTLSQTGTIASNTCSVENTALQIGVDPPSPNCLRHAMTCASAGSASGTGRVNFETSLVPSLVGKHLSRIRLQVASKVSGDNNRSRLLINGVSVLTVLTNTTAIYGWTPSEFPLGQVDPVFTSILEDTGLYNNNRVIETLMTNIEVYGAADNSLLYNTNDVVAHGGAFYRSLYDSNTEEPGTGTKWLAVPPLIP